MWKPEHRRAASRSGLRYPSDLTDGEWAMVEPQIPPASRGGRPRDVDLREVLNAIFYAPWIIHLQDLERKDVRTEAAARRSRRPSSRDPRQRNLDL
jgi:hypothetical protein